MTTPRITRGVVPFPITPPLPPARALPRRVAVFLVRRCEAARAEPWRAAYALMRAAAILEMAAAR